MIRTDTFLISKKSFAIDLSTVTGVQEFRIERNAFSFSGTCNALWFRREDGITRACLGTLILWSYTLSAPLDLDDPHAMLSADLDGRYGGDYHVRWNGEHYWGAQEPHVQALHLTILRPMLAAYPDVPDGYDGWWRF